jgi:hypothetical protein
MRTAQNPKNHKNKMFSRRYSLKNTVFRNCAAHFGDQMRNTPPKDRRLKYDDHRPHFSPSRPVASPLHRPKSNPFSNPFAGVKPSAKPRQYAKIPVSLPSNPFPPFPNKPIYPPPE